MALNRDTRRIQNSKQDSINLVSSVPSPNTMPEGGMVLSFLGGSKLGMFTKQKGRIWRNYFSGDGNQYVDNNLQVNHNAIVKRDLTVDGELKGTRLIFNFGTAIASYVDFYMKTVNGVVMSSNLGYVMHRAGSIVGAGARFQCTTFANSETWSVDILKNNSSVFKPTGVSVTSTTYFSTYGTQARGIDTFVAGDLIQVKMNQTSGLNKAEIDNVIG